MKIAEFLEKEKIYEYAKIPYEKLCVIDKRREERLFGDKKIKTALFFLIPYYTGGERGNVSRYARGRDYHFYIKELEKRAKEALDTPPVICADTSPVAEVSGACLAGLGCVGENSLIINQRYGSYVFIGEMFFTLDENDEFFRGVEKKSAPQKCRGWGACKKACATGGIFDRAKFVSCITQ
jgi:epoxyqueuosine reductase QueG